LIDDERNVGISTGIDTVVALKIGTELDDGKGFRGKNERTDDKEN